MKNIRVLEIKGKKAYLISGKTLDGHLTFLLNGAIISNERKRDDIVINSDDKLQFLSSSKSIINYIRADETISVDEYESKPQWYDEDDSDEHVLSVIANKKELSGFEPNYKDPTPEDVELSIDGYIEDTGSKFISCTISGRYSKNPILYTTCGNRIAMDEYNILRNKHSDHAKFEIPDRSYLRFVKINNKYAFCDSYPFCDNQYRNTYSNIDKARAEESTIRLAVRNRMDRAIFSDELSEIKSIQFLSQLKAIKKLKTKKAMDAVLSILIDDVSDYINHR